VAERNETFASTFIKKQQHAPSDDRILHKLCQYALHPVHQQLILVVETAVAWNRFGA
jgi:hypothetical protein